MNIFDVVLENMRAPELLRADTTAMRYVFECRMSSLVLGTKGADALSLEMPE